MVRCKNCKIVEQDGSNEIEFCPLHCMAERIIEIVELGMIPADMTKTQETRDEEYELWKTTMLEAVAEARGNVT